MNITIADIDSAADAYAASDMLAALAEALEASPGAAPRATRGPRKPRTTAATAPTATADPAPGAPAEPLANTVAGQATPDAKPDAVALYNAMTAAQPVATTPPAVVTTPPPAEPSPAAREALVTRARAVAQDKGATWFMPWMAENIPEDRRSMSKMTDDELNKFIGAAALA